MADKSGQPIGNEVPIHEPECRKGPAKQPVASKKAVMGDAVDKAEPEREVESEDEHEEVEQHDLVFPFAPTTQHSEYEKVVPSAPVEDDSPEISPESSPEKGSESTATVNSSASGSTQDLWHSLEEHKAAVVDLQRIVTAYAKLLEETIKQMSGLQRESIELHNKYLERMEEVLRHLRRVSSGETPEFSWEGRTSSERA